MVQYIQGIEQFKVVVVLTELCKLVIRPPNQLSAVTNESQLFLSSIDSECTIKGDIIILKLR